MNERIPDYRVVKLSGLWWVEGNYHETNPPTWRGIGDAHTTRQKAESAAGFYKKLHQNPKEAFIQRRVECQQHRKRSSTLSVVKKD